LLKKTTLKSEVEFVRPPGSIFEAYNRRPAEPLPHDPLASKRPLATSYANQNIQHSTRKQFQYFTP
jgi:hypothetical protein